MNQRERNIENINRRFGFVPNVLERLAATPAAFEAYLNMHDATEAGQLDEQSRSCIALAVAEASGCRYALAMHATFSRAVGLSEDEIRDSRRGWSSRRHLELLLLFAQQLVSRDRCCDQRAFVELSQGERAEVAAIAAHVLFLEFASLAVGGPLDFPLPTALAEL